MIYIGYILIGIAINGFFGIYLTQENPGTPRWAWYLLAIIGGIIVGLKTLKVPEEDQLKLVSSDLMYTFILIAFALFNMPNGINFIFGAINGFCFLSSFIDKRFLIYIG